MSLVLKPEIDPNNASMLTLITAMAVAGGIEKTTGLECKIKWPNDIVVHGKKSLRDFNRDEYPDGLH